MLDPKQPDYKELILQRAINKNIFKPGDRFKVKGTPDWGTIKEIKYDVSECAWKNNQPYFLFVELDKGMSYLAHPSKLKRKLK